MAQELNEKEAAKYELLLGLAQRYPDLDTAAVETCCIFLQTATDAQAALETYFAEHGLSQGKFTLLMLLFCTPQPGLTPSQCAELACVTRATVTGLLEGLAREGWVNREPHPRDRRRHLITLTQQSRDLLDRILPDYFRLVTTLLGELNPTEKKLLQALLHKFRQGVLKAAHRLDQADSAAANLPSKPESNSI